MKPPKGLLLQSQYSLAELNSSFVSCDDSTRSSWCIRALKFESNETKYIFMSLVVLLQMIVSVFWNCILPCLLCRYFEKVLVARRIGHTNIEANWHKTILKRRVSSRKWKDSAEILQYLFRLSQRTCMYKIFGFNAASCEASFVLGLARWSILIKESRMLLCLLSFTITKYQAIEIFGQSMISAST